LLEARLEALKAQRDSAVARISYDGRSVEYRGTAEIARAIAELERELQAAQGTAPVRQIRVYTSKGLRACTVPTAAKSHPMAWCIPG
jgi:roadblock/LC7 domain-containing protein